MKRTQTFEVCACHLQRHVFLDNVHDIQPRFYVIDRREHKVKNPNVKIQMPNKILKDPMSNLTFEI